MLCTFVDTKVAPEKLLLGLALVLTVLVFSPRAHVRTPCRLVSKRMAALLLRWQRGLSGSVIYSGSDGDFIVNLVTANGTPNEAEPELDSTSFGRKLNPPPQSTVFWQST